MHFCLTGVYIWGKLNHMKQLKVGDKIYMLIRNDRISARYKIDRVTAKYAMSGDMKFRIMYSDDGYVTPAGEQDKWSTSVYRIESTALIEKMQRQLMLGFITKYDWDSAPLSLLSEVYDIIR